MANRTISGEIALVVYVLALPVILLADEKGLVSDESELAKAPTASLHFRESSHDFGKVSQMEKLSHIFKFQNRGDKVLEIQDIKSGCGCMAAVLSNSKTIPPGGTGQLEVTLNTGRRRGRFGKKIVVYSNDPLHPATMLHIGATVKADAIVEPPEVLFGNVNKGETAIKEVQIAGATDKSFKVVKVQATSEHIVVAYPNRSERYDGSAKISVQLKSSAPVGQLRADLSIHIVDEKLKIFEIPVYAVVRGSVRLSPRRLFYGLIKKQAMVKRELRIRFLGNENGSIVNVSSDLPNMHLTVTTIREGKEYSIAAEMAIHQTKGKIKGHVEVHTTSLDQPKIVVPVYAYVHY